MITEELAEEGEDEIEELPLEKRRSMTLNPQPNRWRSITTFLGMVADKTIQPDD